MEGEWTNNPKYGTQFSAQKWEAAVPATVYESEIHKSQGLVYPIVVMPVMMKYFIMLQRYTKLKECLKNA